MKTFQNSLTNRLILSTACFLGFEWRFSDLILNSKFVSDLFRTEHSCCFLIIQCDHAIYSWGSRCQKGFLIEKVVCCIAAAQVIIFYSKLFYRFSIQKLFCFFAHANFFSFVSSFFFFFSIFVLPPTHPSSYLLVQPTQTDDTNNKKDSTFFERLAHSLAHSLDPVSSSSFGAGH